MYNFVLVVDKEIVNEHKHCEWKIVAHEGLRYNEYSDND